MATRTMEYTLAPSWTVKREGSTLRLSGGADARYEVELDTDDTAFDVLVADRGTHVRTITRDRLSVADQRVLEQLVTAEVLRPVIQTGPRLLVAFVGDAPIPHIAAGGALAFTDARDGADVVVIYRATSSMRDLLDAIDYRAVSQPHLFVDAAFHHTVSIGPLVFPGETACLECLYGRIAARWDDDAPPPWPRVGEVAADLIAALTSLELTRIASGDTALANKTTAWDVDSRAVVTDRLLKVQKCPVCTRHRPHADGSIPLPWTES